MSLLIQSAESLEMPRDQASLNGILALILNFYYMIVDTKIDNNFFHFMQVEIWTSINVHQNAHGVGITGLSLPSRVTRGSNQEHPF